MVWKLPLRSILQSRAGGEILQIVPDAGAKGDSRQAAKDPEHDCFVLLHLHG
jgi:hypothetical protein